MPKLNGDIPRYRKHKQSGQAIVTLNGRDHLLGPHGTKASKINYDRLIGEWLARGRQLEPAADIGLTITETIARYWVHVRQHYVKQGRPTSEQAGIRSALRFVKEYYGGELACDFSPIALKAVRVRMIDAGLARGTINQNTGRIRRMFRWAASEQLIPTSVFQSLVVVDGLREGRTIAREPAPVLPVDEAIVDQTLPHLPVVVADMIRFHRLTGCRPSEVCALRPVDLDRSGEVWRYVPQEHKTQHHGKRRVIFIGPAAQGILLRYLARDPEAYCFRPCDSEAKRRAANHAARRTPASCGNVPGSNRVRTPKRVPGLRYTSDSYRRAICRACDRAKLPHWAPNQLRHAAATEIRKKFGLEAAQTVLGHAKASMTEVYAERDQDVAANVARQIG